MIMKTFPSALILLVFLIFISCNGAANHEDKFAALSDSTSFSGLTGDSVKLVKSAAIKCKVHNVERSMRELSDVAKEFDGIIFDQSFESAETEKNELTISKDSLMVITSYMPRADITLRIPSENLEEFMYNAVELGYFMSSFNLHVDDRSLAYLKNTLMQKARTEVLSQPVIKNSPASKSIKRIGVKDEVINQQISNRAIDADVSYSLVGLSLFQNPIVRKEVITNTAISDYQLPFRQRLSDAINNGWKYFCDFILVFAHLWVFLVVMLAFFLTYNLLQKKKLAGVRLKQQ